MKNDLSPLELILSGTENIIPLELLKKKIDTKLPLEIKLGADPTSPNLHLGHVVVLEKLRDFQDLGYIVTFLIGDFTAQIGDPTGKSKTRPPLTEEEVNKNVITYVHQLAKVLDMNKLKIVYNSTWFNTFTSKDWLKLCSAVTVAQITERDDFKKRITSNQPIGLHELLYPLLQAYDSVKLKTDIEIGGTDQTFNLLLGRTLQESYAIDGQIIITMPLIEGTDGIQKMSKSLKNDIGLTEEPQAVFGKIMSINDELMYKYYKVLLRYNTEKIDDIKKQYNHIENKKNLAYLILEKYWSKEAAIENKEYFTNVIQHKIYETEQLKKIHLNSNEKYTIFDIFFLIDNSISRSEIRRLLIQGAITINGIKIDSEKFYFIKKEKEKKDIMKIGKFKIYSLELI